MPKPTSLALTSKAFVAAAALLLVQSNAQASNIASQWYARPVADNVSQFKADGAFGEQIDLKTGSTRFRMTDINVKTNSGMNMSLGRILSMTRTQLEAPQSTYFAHYHPNNTWGVDPTKDAFGRSWELDVPYMVGTYDSRTGWASKASTGWGTTTEYNRCAGSFSAPTVMGVYPAYGQVFQPKDYWGGISINIPGAGQENLLRATPEAIMPNDGFQYVGTTASQWRISCLTAIKNGQGEGFRLVLPDGTKYYFDWMAVKNMPPLMSGGSVIISGNPLDRDTLLDTISPSVLLPLVKAYLYATRVEDRFGNWIEYDYDPANPFRLTAIRSNEGSRISVAYNADGHIQSATQAERTWIYQYDPDLLGNHNLYRVINPDSSYWQYEGLWGLTMLFNEQEDDIKLLQKNCVINIGNMASNKIADINDSAAIRITAPSGLIGVFKFRELVHGSSKSPGRCYTDKIWSVSNSGNSYYVATIVEGAPLLNRVPSLYEREVYGPGVGSLKWNYTYEPNWSYLSQCPHASNCSVLSATTETKPNGDVARHVYGNNYLLNDGKLLSTEDSSAGILSRRVVRSYVESSQGHPFPDAFGTDPNQISNPLVGKNRPITSAITYQDGMSFTTTVNAYDAFARQFSVAQTNTTGSGRTEITDYHDDLSKWVIGQVKRQYNAETGMVMAHTDYNAQALPWKTYRFGKLQNTLNYNLDGTLTTITDGRNQTITLSNWKRGIPQSIQHPATPEAPSGATESAVVNDNGWISSVTNEIGAKTCYTYDPMGRTASILYPSESQLGVCDGSRWSPVSLSFVQVNSDEHGLPAGHWRASRYEGNKHVNTYYDAMWRPVLEEALDASNIAGTLSQVVKKYDVSGRLSFQSYPTTNVGNYWDVTQGTRSFYDALDRVTRVEQDSEHNVLASTTEYLPGLQTRVVNPRGLATVTAFMAWDQPTYDLPIASVQPEGKVIEIARHPQFGWPLQLKQRSADNSLQQVRSYVYDGNAQLCKTIEPETGATVTGYDAANNPVWSASGLTGGNYASTADCSFASANTSGRVVNRTYDARNRISTLSFPDGLGNQFWAYEKDGLPASVTTYNGANNTLPVVNFYSYNKRRLLIGESSHQPGWYTWGLGYDYDSIGNLRWQSYPDSLTLDYAPNALGQPTQVRDQFNTAYASGAQYYPNGALKQFSYGNGIAHTMTQNARQLPARVSSSGGVSDFGYSYDNNANVSLIWDYARDNGNGQYGRWMTYDGLDRLTSAGSCNFGGDCWHRFSYDALDNLKSWKLGGVKDYADYIYEAGTNRLTSIRNTAGSTVVGISYDLQGNLQNKNGQTYEFDTGNRLRGVTGKEYYRYDGHGRRVMSWRYMDGTTTISQYSQSGQLMYQEESAKPASNHIYLGGSLIATRENTWGVGIAIKYQHTDALGSPVAVTNQAGAVIERNDYEPYGAIIGKPNKSGIGYTGHMMDGATGLTYMQQRYYDQSIGRFLSVDPIAVRQKGDNSNRYAYAFNNPYRFTDPDGRDGNETFSQTDAWGDVNYANANTLSADDAIRGLVIIRDIFLSQFSDAPGASIASAPITIAKEARVAVEAVKAAKPVGYVAKDGKVFTNTSHGLD
jgi:RHS repeat-associated protein